MDAELLLWWEWWIALEMRANWSVLALVTSYRGLLARLDAEDELELARLRHLPDGRQPLSGLN